MKNNSDTPSLKKWSQEERDDAWISQRLQLCSKPEGEAGIELAHSMNKEHSRLVDWALNSYPIKLKLPTPKGLDIGCGGGATLQKLHSLYPNLKLSGIDYSADMVALAKEKTTEFATVTEGNVCELPFNDKEFDLVSAVETLYFWPDLAQSLKNVFRVLNDNGTFIIIHEMYEDEKDTTFKHRNDRIKNLSELALFTPEGLCEILQNTGFSVEYTTIAENNWITYCAKKQ